MEKATGNTRKLLKVLGEIQGLACGAKGAYQNDRDPNRYEHVVEPLNQIFNLCVRERGKYEPL